MTTATLPTKQQMPGPGRTRRAPAAPTAFSTAQRDLPGVPQQDIERLSIRLAGPADAAAVQELARTTGFSAPSDGAIVAVLDGRLLAAVSASGEGLSEPSPSGAAAEAIVRYRLADLRRRRVRLRRPGTPS
jgi:hypothetical protein